MPLDLPPVLVPPQVVGRRSFGSPRVFGGGVVFSVFSLLLVSRGFVFGWVGAGLSFLASAVQDRLPCSWGWGLGQCGAGLPPFLPLSPLFHSTCKYPPTHYAWGCFLRRLRRLRGCRRLFFLDVWEAVSPLLAFPSEGMCCSPLVACRRSQPLSVDPVPGSC